MRWAGGVIGEIIDGGMCGTTGVISTGTLEISGQIEEISTKTIEI